MQQARATRTKVFSLSGYDRTAALALAHVLQLAGAAPAIGASSAWPPPPPDLAATIVVPVLLP